MDRENEFSEKTDFCFAPGDTLDTMGVIQYAEWECPGIQYISVEDGCRCTEYYAVSKRGFPLSQEAAAYGLRLPGFPQILLYPLYQENGGWKIIEYETQRFCLQNHLPLPEGVKLRTTAEEGKEAAPAYFGAYPAPSGTPWGRILRYREIGNGIFWLETETLRQALAVCQLWSDDLSEAALALAARGGTPESGAYLFFDKQDCCVPVFELLPLHPQWLEKNTVDRAALMNAVCLSHPAYALRHNFQEQKGTNDLFGQLMQSLGADYQPHRSLENMLHISDAADSEFFPFLR